MARSPRRSANVKRPSAEGLAQREERISGALAEMDDIMSHMEDIEERAALRVANAQVDAAANATRSTWEQREAPSPSSTANESSSSSSSSASPPVRQTVLSEKDGQTLDFMLAQLAQIAATEGHIHDRLLLRRGGNGIGPDGEVDRDAGQMFKRAQANRKRKEQQQQQGGGGGNGGLSMQGRGDVPIGPSELSWAQTRSIEEHREAFLAHRASVELSLRGTGMSQANVVEVLEELITEELVGSCAKEVEALLGEFVETIKLEA